MMILSGSKRIKVGVLSWSQVLRVLQISGRRSNSKISGRRSSGKRVKFVMLRSGGKFQRSNKFLRRQKLLRRLLLSSLVIEKRLLLLRLVGWYKSGVLERGNVRLRMEKI